MTNNVGLARTLKACRVQSGYTRETLAPLAGMSEHRLILIEQGKAEPTIDETVRIADALEVPLSVLMLLANTGDVAEDLNKNGKGHELANNLANLSMRLIAGAHDNDRDWHDINEGDETDDD